MSFSQGFSTLNAKPVFSGKDFCHIEQLADILFNPVESVVSLVAEHEAVVQCWIASSLNNSKLGRKSPSKPSVVPLSYANYQALSAEHKTSLMQRQFVWIYLGNGKLIRASKANWQLMESGHEASVLQAIAGKQVLTFPWLKLNHQCAILTEVLAKTYNEAEVNIPKHTLERVLEWQSIYCQKDRVLTESIKMVQRAVNRLLMTQTEVEQVVLLEPHHVAEVIADWQQINLAEILRPVDDTIGMREYLNSHVVYQTDAVYELVKQYQSKQVFIFAGPKQSGRTTLARYFARFLNGHERFSIPVDLRWFGENDHWGDIMLPTPSAYGEHQALVEIVNQYPSTVFFVKGVEHNAEKLKKLMKFAQQRVGFSASGEVDFSRVTWVLLLETEQPNQERCSTVEDGMLAGEDELAGLEELLYHEEEARLDSSSSNNDMAIDHHYLHEQLIAVLPKEVYDLAAVIPFQALNEKAVRAIISKTLKMKIRRLRISWGLPLYFQEEVVNFLHSLVSVEPQGLNALDGILEERIVLTFNHALKTKSLKEKQAFMLQLNESGCILTAEVVDQPSVLQGQINIGANSEFLMG